MTTEPKIFIAVIGEGQASEKTARLAYEVGKLIAQNHAVLVCGGLGGVMEESCRGANDAGGTTVGLLPGGEHKDANPFVSIPIATGLGIGRNLIVVRTAQAVIAIGGRFGTLSEIGLALNLGIPVVGLTTWEVSRADQLHDPIYRVDTPEEAVELALKLARERM